MAHRSGAGGSLTRMDGGIFRTTGKNRGIPDPGLWTTGGASFAFPSLHISFTPRTAEERIRLFGGCLGLLRAFIGCPPARACGNTPITEPYRPLRFRYGIQAALSDNAQHPCRAERSEPRPRAAGASGVTGAGLSRSRPRRLRWCRTPATTRPSRGIFSPQEKPAELQSADSWACSGDRARASGGSLRHMDARAEKLAAAFLARTTEFVVPRRGRETACRFFVSAGARGHVAAARTRPPLARESSRPFRWSIAAPKREIAAGKSARTHRRACGRSSGAISIPSSRMAGPAPSGLNPRSMNLCSGTARRFFCPRRDHAGATRRRTWYRGTTPPSHDGSGPAFPPGPDRRHYRAFSRCPRERMGHAPQPDE